MDYEVADGKLVVALDSRIDTNNAHELEDELRPLVDQETGRTKKHRRRRTLATIGDMVSRS